MLTLSRSESTRLNASVPLLMRRVSEPSPPLTVAAASRFAAEVKVTTSLAPPASMLSAPPPPVIVSLPPPPEIVSALMVPIKVSTPLPPTTEKPLLPVARLRSIEDPAAAAFKVAMPALLVSAVATKAVTLLAMAVAAAATCNTSPVVRSVAVNVSPLARKRSLPAPPVKVALPLVLVRMSA